MQLFYDKGARGKDLQKLNQCRMFLQVTMLSDIVTADNRYITRTAREGNFDNTWPHYHRWPNQGNPGVNKRTFWREQLSSLLCGGNRDFRLMTALGAWTDTTPGIWEWFFCLYEEHLYRQSNSEWTYYLPGLLSRQRRRSRPFIIGGQVPANDVPPNLRRVTVDCVTSQDVLLTSYSQIEQVPSTPSPPTSLEETITELPETTMWLIAEHFCNDSGINVANAIRNGTAIAVSNGSFKESFGMAALIIEGDNKTKHFIAINVTPGHPEDQSSLRSELSGLFGILIGCQPGHLFCSQHPIWNYDSRM
jgi:hypothetical protein